jgi:hypothetical protein
MIISTFENCFSHLKKLQALFLFFAFLTGPLRSQTICSYKYRKRITFNASQVSGINDLTDFPAYLHINSDDDLRTVANGGHVENNSGFDIIFTTADGVTLLDHELTSYNANTGAMDCWVKIPALSPATDTFIYMYYGNSAISSSQSAPSTWSNGFAGVWHLDNSLNNATAVGGLNGTDHNSTNTGTSKIGSARNFASASSQYVDITPYNSAYDLTSDITVSAWVQLVSLGVDQKFAGNQDNTSGGWKFGVFTDNKIEFEIRTSGNSPVLSRSATGGTALSSGTWYYVVGQYSDTGDFIKTYRDGALDRNLSTNAVNGSSSGTMKFAREPFASSAFLNGIIVEMRVTNVISSADLIATEYNNQNSPSTFYSISAEPKIWDGSSSQSWNTNQNWSNNSKPGSGQDVIIPTVVRQPTLNVSPQIGSLWIQPTMTLNISTRSLQVRYDITNCGVIDGSTGTLVLNGTSTAIQNQNLSGSGTYAPNNLVINNTFAASPSVTLNSPVTVSGSLVLSSGVVVTSLSNILTLGSSAGSSPGSSGSYVSGPISKVGGTQSFVFPTGKGGMWRRIGVTNLSGTASFRAEYFNSVPSNTGSVNAPLTDVSVLEYWQLDRIAGTGNARVSLYWEDATLSGITTCSDLTIARNNGASWDERAATTLAGSSCSGAGTGTITTTAVVTAFSPFTFGSKQPGAINPLPITLLDFLANCNKNEIDLEWHTATEKNNAYFILQKSVNGYDWNEISRTKGAGTTKTGRGYSFSDNQNINGQNYYRLAQVDFDGRQSSWWTIETNCIKANDQMKIYPNPSSGKVNIDFSMTTGFTRGTLEVTSATGRLCYRDPFIIPGKNATYTLPLKLDPGVYFVRFRSDNIFLPAERLMVAY